MLNINNKVKNEMSFLGPTFTRIVGCQRRSLGKYQRHEQEDEHCFSVANCSRKRAGIKVSRLLC